MTVCSNDVQIDGSVKPFYDKSLKQHNKIVKDNDPALVYRYDVTSFEC